MREQAIKIAKIRQLKLLPPFTVPSGTKTLEVISRMRKSKQTCALVLKGEQCVGIFTERDFLMKILGSKAGPSGNIDDWMSREPKTLTMEDSLEQAVFLMQEFGYRNIPLVDQKGTCVGLLQIRNLIDFLAELYPQELLNRPPREDQRFSEPDGA